MEQRIQNIINIIKTSKLQKLDPNTQLPKINEKRKKTKNLLREEIELTENQNWRMHDFQVSRYSERDLSFPHKN